MWLQADHAHQGHQLHPPFLQYVFTVRKAACKTCPPQVFKSNTTTGLLTNLAPDTLVGTLPFAGRALADKDVPAPPVAKACFTCLPQTSMKYNVLSGPQYNVTVVGVDSSGRQTQGANMLQFRTPQTGAGGLEPPSPSPPRTPRPPVGGVLKTPPPPPPWNDRSVCMGSRGGHPPGGGARVALHGGGAGTACAELSTL